ncbi:hypothetical protein ANCDUO_03084 [Ancylostoma duodenale]|uniref:Uncharacterized protein n=1 Tax=Ancylostoma duodenale TaxID=51022 RepID=A0A0C2H4V4_9BILA|nr:hypothetical protein ANCDUO_03084 [Ancylostoma duodenale]
MALTYQPNSMIPALYSLGPLHEGMIYKVSVEWLSLLFYYFTSSHRHSLTDMWGLISEFSQLIGQFVAKAEDLFTHTWSIAVEMQFYVIFPVIFVIYKVLLGLVGMIFLTVLCE